VSRELRVAIAAARAGAAELVAARGGELRIDYKDARANLVTVADRRSQQAITDVILDAFPSGHAIDGEEGTAGDRDAEHVWYVDPLDGTTNYCRGLPFFCVSIALRSAFSGAGAAADARGGGGKTIAGVVYDPTHDELFAADEAGGATLNGRPLRVSAVATLDRSLVVAQAQTVDPAEIAAYGRLVERLMSVTSGVRSLGSPALTLCAIAAGRLEGYCEYAMDAWDIAAGQLILQQAGGTLTLFDGSPHATAERADVVASNRHIHPALIAALEDLP
jgi:myo-inositol-1(or 4)-monophosphatase